MRIAPAALEAHLAHNLKALYLVTGDEPLQAQEALAAIRAAARRQGYLERLTLNTEPHFTWQELHGLASSGSLFSSRRLIELSFKRVALGKEGSQALCDYCARPPRDVVVLMQMPRLDKQAQSSKWFKTLEDFGGIVVIWPVPFNELPRWLAQRMRHRQLEPSPQALAILAERIEGNLLAAQQEIDKLLLLQGPGPVNERQMLAAITDSARFDPFQLADAILEHQPARALHILRGLEAEGIAPSLIVWALARDLRVLAQADAAGGIPAAHSLKPPLPKPHLQLLAQAARRRPASFWMKSLSRCLEVDRAIKGQSATDPWRELLGLTEQLLNLDVCPTLPRRGVC